MVLFRPVPFVIDVRDRAHRDAEHRIGRRRNATGVELRPGPRVIKEWRRCVVARADDERNLIFLLQIVEFLCQHRKFIKRANSIGAERQVPHLEFIGVLLQR